jgi:hypothetical protein
VTWDEDRSWVQPGTEVAYLSHGWHDRIMGTDRIVKVGKRDIVLTNGRRFNVNTLLESAAMGRGSYLYPADHPRVTIIPRREAARNAGVALKRTVENFSHQHGSYGPEDLAPIQEALDAARDAMLPEGER